MWAFGCGIVSSGVSPGTALAADRRRRAAGGTDGVRHQPGRERLVRPPRRRHQRAGPADSVGPHSRPLGPLYRDRLDRAVAAARDRARHLGFCRGRRRACAGLGLQRAADPAEAERLVGQRRLRALLRRPALVHRRRGDERGAARLAHRGDRAALQRRRPRHHDPERFQVGRGRQADGHRFAAGAARRRQCRALCLPGDGGAAGGRGGAAAGCGSGRSMPPPSARCWSRSSS